MPQQVFDVDYQGLSELIEDAGPTRLIWELVRNSLDEDGVTSIGIELNPMPGRPLIQVVVTDDAPEGFKDLAQPTHCSRAATRNHCLRKLVDLISVTNSSLQPL